MEELSNLRKEYVKGSLERKDLDKDPIAQFRKWMKEAMETEDGEPTAMSLATVDMHHVPHVRIVLLKDITSEGFVFFTNYKSNKGVQIANNPMVAATFYWPKLERQVRIVGKALKTSTEVSDKYFKMRPPNSRIGAWISPQSSVIDDYWIEQHFKQYSLLPEEQTLERPAQWGGYIIKPFEIEFWQGRPSRLHDRFVYRNNHHLGWSIDRLAP
ncbi:MAG: pyridoxamine 5'-phosphate oxidase [Bacteroidales bacterium]